MAPRTGPRVKVISPNSGTVTTLSRSVSVSSAYGSSHVSPASSTGRHHGDAHQRSGEREEKPFLRRFAAAAAVVTPPPPQSGRAVLRAMGINIAAPPSSISKKHRDAPAHCTPPPPSTYDKSTASDCSLLNNSGGHHSSYQRTTAPVDHRPPPRGGGDLPNYYDEAELRRAGHAAPTRRRPPPPSSVSSASRSTSRMHPTQGPQRTRSRHDDHEENEDQEAIRRARTALEHAGDAVLRRPFSNISNASGGTNGKTKPSSATGTSASSTSDASANKSVSTLLSGNTSSLPMRPASASPGARMQFTASRQESTQRRGMRLPSVIPITRAGSEGEEDELEDNDEDGLGDASFNAPSKRARSWADIGTENAAATLARRRNQTAAATGQAGDSICSPCYTASASAQQRSPDGTSAAGVRVCPGMFSGVSAIPLDPRLFEGMEHNVRANVTPSPASPLDWKDTVKTGSSVPQQRYCARPLWSLVGTFKTSLSGLVTVDFYQDCLRWFQRNPKGGQQCIRVPLAQLSDAFTTRVVQEDEHIEEKQYTVVVRTSTRPSQVVFGFATVAEANALRNILKRR
ncbi:hypothetical protein ABL78_3293 [Leptomonas seymouri]|uniref:PH-like domain-containing protein n=1 Tax=Leptomonas seymouri TaxID=5684 RepID=A0A0N0P6H1_LEPSE|nr:hypothetical protein ABL78_3293 [Leptomonas seymouri]|eukprot:KPI87636.1 hypothetical protein ABL78_3293 [Leptomonas seymouri]